MSTIIKLNVKFEMFANIFITLSHNASHFYHLFLQNSEHNLWKPEPPQPKCKKIKFNEPFGFSSSGSSKKCMRSSLRPCPASTWLWQEMHSIFLETCPASTIRDLKKIAIRHKSFKKIGVMLNLMLKYISSSTGYLCWILGHWEQEWERIENRNH